MKVLRHDSIKQHAPKSLSFQAKISLFYQLKKIFFFCHFALVFSIHKTDYYIEDNEKGYKYEDRDFRPSR